MKFKTIHNTLTSCSVLFLGFILSGTTLNISSPFSVERILQRIEKNQGHWIGFESNVKLHFLTADRQSASCHGVLHYHRLGEKILLKCFNDKKKLVFSFKTTDWDFELYVPMQNTVFKGNIFDLEDSPDIDSHLRPLNLYRALKVMSIPIQQTKVDRWNKNTVSLKVYKNIGHLSHLSRSLVSTQEGDVILEVYYDREAKPSLNIHRSSYKRIRDYQTSTQDGTIRFPHQITMEHIKNTKENQIDETILLFANMNFLPDFDSADWSLNIPPDTTLTQI